MLSRSMEKVVIVGAGLTGAITASSFRQTFGDRIDIEVLDKSRGTGGFVLIVQPAYMLPFSNF